MGLACTVGRKRELYLPREAREALGLKPGDKLVVELGQGEVTLRKVPSLQEILMAKPKVKISLKEDLELRAEISRSLES